MAAFLFLLGACFAQSAPTIYASIVSHSEEPPTNPNYIENPDLFYANRAELLYFARMLHRHGIRLNWQSEWNFLGAVALYDSGIGTGGLNIVEYMHDSLGFEIDPHAHETVYNYADVAHFIEDVGVEPSHTVGGFIAMPPESSVLEHFFAPIEADSFPGYVWTAEILWGAATKWHTADETLWVSGIWKPKCADSFFVHDDSKLPHVGRYRSSWEGVWDLIEKAEAGLLDPNKMYTVTVFVAQALLSHEFTDRFEDMLDSLAPYVDSGRLRWVTLQEAVQIWRTEYDSVPNMFWYETTSEGLAERRESGGIVRAYPNPFRRWCVIERCGGSAILDVGGRCVAKIPKGAENFVWTPGKSTPNGLYIIVDSKGRALGRLLLIR